MAKEKEMKRSYIKENGFAGLVRELVEGIGVDSESAIDYVYDMKTLSNEEFAAKYIH